MNNLGLRLATVTKDTGDVDGLNRVEIELLNSHSKIPLPPAPVVTDSTGEKWGTVSVPRKGDIVLVGFLDDNMERPVIIGSIPTKQRKPPIKLDQKNDSRVHYTSGGTKITIHEDEKKSTIIKIETPSGNTFNLENNLFEFKSSKGDTSISVNTQNREINLSADKVTIEGKKEISFKSGSSSVKISNSGIESKSPSGKFDVSANQINSKANSTMQMEANAQIKIQGTAGVSAKSSGMTEIGGSIVKIG